MAVLVGVHTDRVVAHRVVVGGQRAADAVLGSLLTADYLDGDVRFLW